MTRRFALAASALVTATAIVAAHAQTYIVAEVPRGPRDVSNSTLITGVNRNLHAFVWDSGMSTDLGTLGSFASAGYGVNSLGQVVGDSRLNEGCQFALCWHAFLWQDGIMTDLGTPGRLENSIAFAINNAGQVAGFDYEGIAIPQDLCFPPSSPFEQLFYSGGWAVLWENGVATRLRPPADLRFSQARDINNAGQIVGFWEDFRSRLIVQRAFIWEDGTMTDLPGEGGEAYAINDSGQVVGRAGPFVQSQAVRWIDGQFIALGTLGGPKSGAWDINNRGQIVGWAETDVIGANDCPVGHAFLFEDGRMIDLNDRLPPDSGWELLDARAINDRGQIVGRGVIDGRYTGFLLTPITGDTDGDGDVDLADLLSFGTCFSGPGVARPAEPACSEVDLDADGDVDLADLVAFQANFTGSH